MTVHTAKLTRITHNLGCQYENNHIYSQPELQEQNFHFNFPLSTKAENLNGYENAKQQRSQKHQIRFALIARNQKGSKDRNQNCAKVRKTRNSRASNQRQMRMARKRQNLLKQDGPKLSIQDIGFWQKYLVFMQG